MERDEGKEGKEGGPANCKPGPTTADAPSLPRLAATPDMPSLGWRAPPKALDLWGRWAALGVLGRGWSKVSRRMHRLLCAVCFLHVGGRSVGGGEGGTTTQAEEGDKGDAGQ